jgi:hypothetical protein
MLKRLITCSLMIGIVALALASSGGGDKKRSTLRSDIKPLSTSGFSLKSGPKYTGSLIHSAHKNRNFVLYNTVVTYQKGNTIYVLPYKYKMATAKPCFKSNLNIVDLKINLHK